MFQKKVLEKSKVGMPCQLYFFPQKSFRLRYGYEKWRQSVIEQYMAQGRDLHVGKLRKNIWSKNI
jgi:hypothetical protein